MKKVDQDILKVPISVGELFDKFSILEIKQSKITDTNKLEKINKEIGVLKPLISNYDISFNVYNKLKEINLKLWDIEDKLRIKESKKEFDDEFIKLARSVYFSNDIRGDRKREINKIFNSELEEVKDYVDYKSNKDIENDSNVKNEKKIIRRSPLSGHSELTNKDHTTYNINMENESDVKKVNDAVRLFNMANGLLRSGDFKGSIERYKKAISIIPDFKDAYNNMANCYKELNDIDSAIDCYKEAININSEFKPSYKNIGCCLQEKKEYEEAIRYYKRGLESDYMRELDREFYANMGSCYDSLKEFEIAEKYCRKSISLDTDFHVGYFNLGNIYHQTKRLKESIELYDHVLKNNAGLADDKAYFNKSYSLMCMGDWKTGFNLYENRFTVSPKNYLAFHSINLPTWKGNESCNNLMVIGEQGLGDHIQFYRYMLDLLEVYPDMKISYYTTFRCKHFYKKHPRIKILQQYDSVNLSEYDYKLSLISLPERLKIDSVDPYDVKNTYIVEDEDNINLWKAKLTNLKKFRIGLCWKGNDTTNIEKYIPLKFFKNIADLDVDIICLQKGDGEEEINNVDFNIHRYSIDNDRPFEDTLAILKNIDLLITIDTSMVHIAGLLGVKTWLILGYVSEWRWGLDEKKNVWYDSVELFRSKKPKEWEYVLEDVRDAIHNRFLYSPPLG